MKRFLRVCVWPAACGLAVMTSGCAADNESEAQIKGDAPVSTSASYTSQSKGGVSDTGKSYPGAAKGQAKAKAAEKPADKAPAPAK